MRRAGRRVRVGCAAVLAAVVAAVSTACGPTLADVPLPGSGVGGDTIEITVPFDEALNLARGAAVKVNGVASGKVREVTVRDFKAYALLDVRKDAEMRVDATARLRYTTPLGELFVDVTNPAEGTVLGDGDTLDPARASTAPTVEDALSSASLLVNGGGLNQLQTVTDELNQAFSGREGDVRRLLARADTFLTRANATTGDIDRLLTALGDVSTVLADNDDVVDAALRDIRPAARVLRENTPQFSELLKQLRTFAGTANEVVGGTREQLVQMMNLVSPVLDEFLANSAVLGPSLRDLVALEGLLNAAVPGDYANMVLTAHLDGLEFNVLGEPGSGGVKLPILGDTAKELLSLGGLSRSSGDEPSSPLSISGLIGGGR